MNAEPDLVEGAPTLVRSLDKTLARLPSMAVVGIGLLCVGVIGWIDLLTGPFYAFSFLYLVPIAAVAWYAGRGRSLLLAVLATVVGMIGDLVGGREYRLSSVVPVWNAAARLATFAVVVLVLAQLRRTLERQRELARTDALTGLANPRWFTAQVELEAARMQRSGRPLSLAYLDLDDFKLVNDHLGHAAGDTLLALVGAELRATTRAGDVVGRMGGDEFAVLLPETDLSTAQTILERVRDRLARTLEAGRWTSTVSVGIATFRGRVGSADEMISCADRIMYLVKREGKNRTVGFEFADRLPVDHDGAAGLLRGADEPAGEEASRVNALRWQDARIWGVARASLPPDVD
jgi:diguanylate cyclase (GGDEF)-like protein